MSSTNFAADVKVWQPLGNFTTTAAKEMQNQFKEHLQNGTRFVLINLQDVKFMDSFGLGVLVSMHSKLKMAGGQLCLCNPSLPVQNLFDLADMNRLFNIVSDHQAFFDLLPSQRRAN
jgi:anti-sigma B factor antagonist